MNDAEILKRVSELVDEEHQLYELGEQGGLKVDERARMHALAVSLDQCWDLLRQRRARREFGGDPNDAVVRDAATVEHYEQ